MLVLAKGSSNLEATITQLARKSSVNPSPLAGKYLLSNDKVVIGTAINSTTSTEELAMSIA